MNIQQLSLGFAGSVLPRPPSDTLREGGRDGTRKSLQSCLTRQLARIAYSDTHLRAACIYIHGLGAALPSLVFNPDDQFITHNKIHLTNH